MYLVVIHLSLCRKIIFMSNRLVGKINNLKRKKLNFPFHWMHVYVYCLVSVSSVFSFKSKIIPGWARGDQACFINWFLFPIHKKQGCLWPKMYEQSKLVELGSWISFWIWISWIFNKLWLVWCLDINDDY